MTFSVAEINTSGAGYQLELFGEFSTIELISLAPASGCCTRCSRRFVSLMGLKPVLGRLLNASDDGREAESVVVLTHRFWTNFFKSDPSVIGKPMRFTSGVSTIVGVLEPSVPYPVETEFIANMVTSPHHLGATMNVERVHRMTELFGRLARARPSKPRRGTPPPTPPWSARTVSHTRKRRTCS